MITTPPSTWSVYFLASSGSVSYTHLDVYKRQEQQLARDKMRGHLFENFIVMEAFKHRYNHGKESNLFFYRDSNGVEVDLLFKNGNDYSAIEIKSSQTYHPEFETGIKSLNSLLKSRLTNKAIIYAGVFENDTAEIQLLNYKNMNQLF